MNIVTVIPFAKNMSKETLTYFTKQDVHVGDIVSIPLRKKIVRALAVSVSPLSSSISEIRKTDFALRKITKVHGQAFIAPGFLEGSAMLAEYTASGTGEILNALLPKHFAPLSAHFSDFKIEIPESKPNIKTEILAFQAPLLDRLGFYKTFIREIFAKKESIIFCFPTEYDIDVFKQSLEKGVAQYIYVLTGKLTEKQIIETTTQIMENPHPVVIFTTPSYLFIPRHDVATIIIEHESSPGYKQLKRPHLDVRTFAEYFAEKRKIKLIFADTLLRTETIWREREKIIGSLAPLNFRLAHINQPTIVDSKKNKEDTKKETYRIFATQTKSVIETALTEKKKVFVFTLRKGLAPVTVCNNCGTSVVCDKCTTPLTLHEINKTKRIFSCPVCKTQKDPKMVCQVCQGWDLRPLGIGADSVASELRTYFPNTPILRIDKEHTKTKRDAQKIITEFDNTPGSILVGTEMALFYLAHEIDVTVVASFDSLFSIPSFRIYERIMHLQMMLAERTKYTYLIQTKNNDEPILHALEGNNLIQFYQNELAIRKEFHYPPFSRFIKLSIETSKENIGRERTQIEDKFGGYPLSFFKSNKMKSTGKQVLHTVIKIDTDKWPLFPSITNRRDEFLKNQLQSLTPAWSIDVDPEDVA
jgi:primosomal protein N'